MRKLPSVPLTLAATATVGLAYATAVEPKMFRLRRIEVPVLPPGVRSLRILQLSDIHMIPGQHRKIRWLRSLAALEPDFVVNTGDNLSSQNGIDPVVEGLEPLLEFPGAFVLGSNDYYAPRLLNPLDYLRSGDPSTRSIRSGLLNDWRTLRDTFTKSGWLDVSNQTGRLDLADGRGPSIGLVGVDDPHIREDRYEQAAAGLEGSSAKHVPDTDVTLGVVHAPYRRVLNAMTADGIPFILAGHTHGGQLRIPFVGALVTNCDLDRRRASGLSTYSVDDQTSFLHVSAGCGTSFYARARFCCPPEATLLTLTERA